MYKLHSLSSIFSWLNCWWTTECDPYMDNLRRGLWPSLTLGIFQLEKISQRKIQWLIVGCAIGLSVNSPVSPTKGSVSTVAIYQSGARTFPASPMQSRRWWTYYLIGTFVENWPTAGKQINSRQNSLLWCCHEFKCVNRSTCCESIIILCTVCRWYNHILPIEWAYRQFSTADWWHHSLSHNDLLKWELRPFALPQCSQ